MTREDKIKQKIKRNAWVLETWHESITKYYVLNSKETKALMHCYTKESDEAKKIEIRNVIVLGTLEYVYQFLKQSIFINIICNWFEMEDVINATIEAWINYLSSKVRPKKYKLDSKYVLYSANFCNHILNNLCGNDIKSFTNGCFFQKELANFSRRYYLYLKERNNNPNYSFNEFKKLAPGKTISDEGMRKIYDAFRFLTETFVIYSKDISVEVIDSLKFILYLAFNMSACSYDNKTYGEEEMLDHEFAQELFLNDATSREQDILYKLYYLDKTPLEIVREDGVTKQGVSLVAHTFYKRVRSKYNL